MTTQTKTNWRKVKIGDLVSLVSETFNFRNRDKIIFLNTSDVENGHILNHTETAISSLPGQAKKKIKRGDILYSEIRPKNKHVARVSFDADDYVVSTKLMVLRPDTKFSADFTYLALMAPRTISDFQTIAESRSGTFPQITFDAIKDYEVLIPNQYTEQQSVADILSAFDDKIELNDKISRTLEEMAQAIFKEWFVKNPPEGTDVPLTEMASFINGGAFGKIVNRNRKGLPLVKIAEFSRGITENTEWVDSEIPQKYLIKDGDLLFSWSGSLELHLWHKGEAVLNQHLFNVVPKIPYTRGLLYVILRSMLPWFRQIALSKATSMGHIQRRHLKEQKVKIPDKNLKIFDDLYQKLVALMIENQKLAALRDLLLPKLMSGEIKVRP